MQIQNILDKEYSLRRLHYLKSHHDQDDIYLNVDFYDSNFDKTSHDDPYPVFLPILANIPIWSSNSKPTQPKQGKENPSISPDVF